MLDMDDVATIFDYHDQTKHHFRRYARSAGHLDWANQPHSFREYQGAERIALPLDVEPQPFAYSQLYAAGAVKPQPVDLRSLSLLLRYSLSLSAWKQAGESRWALRVNPSSGNLHPTEAYLLVDSLIDPDRPTLVHYVSEQHAIERRAVFGAEVWWSLAATLPRGSFLFGLTSIVWREAWKYGERAFRYCQHDTGHALAAMRLSAAMLGWQVRLLSSWSTDQVDALLGTDRKHDFPTEELEEPELLAVVMPGSADSAITEACPPPAATTLGAIRASDWFGKANRLSDQYVGWPLIDSAAMATRKPLGRGALEQAVADFTVAGLAEPRDVEAHRIILQRRSALDMDGQSSTSRDVFVSMLARLLPRKQAPWDVLDWSPKIHLALFVHRVQGLVPGLYLLVRDPAQRDALQAAMRSTFLWQTPPDVPNELPLFLLTRADCRDAARQLSCHQEIAADGFFSLGMLAEFAEPIRRHGAWFYRALFWEAGLVGQVLYLEAEAWGARATGIGCYFDDPVHDVLGLRDHRFQSLYHFAVGVPVDDPRLQSWPPYQ
ncbi:MAG TPA: SagB/ThcOx family dehydrogenase [Pirellulales bacterium]|jgi:SagB-type dehydrogenase family enzyme|nr:SagB/ThcOx family dehydrogenase [Pirellulales bacterium]